MKRIDQIEHIQKGLKLTSEVDDDLKKEGLDILQSILQTRDEQLVELGYDQVIFKELIKLAQFEKEQTLNSVLELLQVHFFKDKKYWDELAETLIYKVARSTDYDVCRVTMEKISILIDEFDDSIAKHSKQLLKLADLNDNTSLNDIMSEILTKLEVKLPKRKSKTSYV